jgi:hypothetical protein
LADPVYENVQFSAFPYWYAPVECTSEEMHPSDVARQYAEPVRTVNLPAGVGYGVGTGAGVVTGTGLGAAVAGAAVVFDGHTTKPQAEQKGRRPDLALPVKSRLKYTLLLVTDKWQPVGLVACLDWPFHTLPMYTAAASHSTASRRRELPVGHTFVLSSP